MKKCLCIDIGGTTIKYGIVDESLAVGDYGSVPTDTNSYEALRESLIRIIESHKEKVEAISLAIPGSIDAKACQIADAGAIFCLANKPLKADLKKICELPIYMENDANCAALAEFHQGAGRGSKNMALMVLGTGIGGSLILNGQILQTKHNFFGEFGYLIMDGENGRAWDEMNGSVVRMVDKIKEQNLILAGLEGKEIFDLYKANQTVTKYLDEFYKMLAIGCYNLQVLLDLDVIVLGGGISVREDFIDNIYEAMNHLQPDPRLPENPLLKTAQYRNNANLIGAFFNAENS